MYDTTNFKLDFHHQIKAANLKNTFGFMLAEIETLFLMGPFTFSQITEPLLKEKS